MKIFALSLILAMQAAQQPAPAATPGGQPIVERPSSPEHIEGERQRHRAHMPTQARGKRCGKTLWLKPCPVKIQEMP